MPHAAHRDFAAAPQHAPLEVHREAQGEPFHQGPRDVRHGMRAPRLLRLRGPENRGRQAFRRLARFGGLPRALEGRFLGAMGAGELVSVG